MSSRKNRSWDCLKSGEKRPVFIGCKLVLKAAIIGLFLFASVAACAEEIQPPEKWGLAMGVRIAQVPFEDTDSTISDIFPLFFYEKGDFYLDGLEAGYRLFKGKNWSLAPVVRYRFVDIPSDYLDEDWRDALDMGGRFTYIFGPRFRTDLELLSDTDGNFHAIVQPAVTLANNSWEIESYARVRWKSDDFNERYYGLDIEDPGDAIDFTVGIDARYHVVSNLYLLGQASATFIDSDTRSVSFIDRSVVGSVFAGFGVFDDKENPPSGGLRSRPYVRLAHGWATESSLGEILTFQGVEDDHDNQLTSVFIGIPLSDTVFTLPVSVYLTPGFVYHYSSDFQDSMAEYVLAVNFYYEFKRPFLWRIGFAEGLSYTSDYLYLEKEKFEEASRLMNYLNICLEVNLGELFGADFLEALWLGYGIHHRSGIFGQSSAFNEISGGSNYNTFYLQYHW